LNILAHLIADIIAIFDINVLGPFTKTLITLVCPIIAVAKNMGPNSVIVFILGSFNNNFTISAWSSVDALEISLFL
jgi:hypothetical protein